MYLTRLVFVSALFFTLSSMGQEEKDAPALKLSGFSHPESVVMDEERNVIYVSNIGKKEPGDGFISKLSPEGGILDIEWITGLNDPKGLLVQNDRLYVTDNKDLVEMDLLQGKITRRTAVEGAEFLNDIAVDASGNLYISDTGKSSIFILEPSGKIREWINSEQLEKPNGLLVDGDDILVAAWGADGSGNVLKVNRGTREISKISKSGIGNLDGIQRAGKKGFYISDWASGKIYSIDLDGNLEEIFTSAKSAGDILFLREAGKLVLPMNHQNEIWWYKLE